MANSPICSISNCGKPTCAKGLCRRHYRKKQASGDATKGLRAENGAAKTFLETVVVNFSEDECLIWPYSKTTYGYGTFSDNGSRTLYVHRIACIRRHGPSPTPKHHVAHSCGNGHLGCVNPTHLRWATPKENHSDKVKHNTQLRGVNVWNAKLTEEEVIEIRENTNLSSRQLEKNFNVTARTIRSVRSRRLWSWLK